MKNLVFLCALAGLVAASLTASPAFADVKMAREVESKTVHFDKLNFKLSPDARLILDQAVKALSLMNDSYSLKIMGFTDSNGNGDLNQALSVQRANSVASYMIAKGIDAERILIQGKGMSQPVAPNDSEEGRNLNRRVEFKFITPDTSNLTFVASADNTIPEPKKDVPEVDSDEKSIEFDPTAAETESPAPAFEPQPRPKKKKPKRSKQNDDFTEIQHEPIRVAPERVRNGTTLVSEKRKTNTNRFPDHVYEMRKRSDQGQTYIDVSPTFASLNGAQRFGATSNKISSQVSFRGEAGWVSFVEDDEKTFVSAKVYGTLFRFNAKASSKIAENQKQFPFGADLGLGHYFHPSVYLQIQSGYGKELNYHLNSSNDIEMDTDFIWHAGLSAEAVAWRFSRLGDIGVNGVFNYYDFGHGTIESGSSFGMNFFVDYDFLRAGFGFSKVSLDDKSSSSFSNWQFGPTFRAYF